VATAAKPSKATQEVVVIPRLKKRQLRLKIKGTSSVISHPFSEKAKKGIEDKQQQKAKGPREKRDPKAEFLAACYVMPGKTAGKRGCVYAIPANAFKQAAICACRHIDGMTMAKMKGSIFVKGIGNDDLTPIKFSGAHPEMREDAVRLPNGNLDLRYRPEFHDWSCEILVEYNDVQFSAEQIVSLFQYAGFHCGVLEMRPERGYSHGMFEVT
jgi:hypothetical protein